MYELTCIISIPLSHEQSALHSAVVVWMLGYCLIQSSSCALFFQGGKKWRKENKKAPVCRTVCVWMVIWAEIWAIVTTLQVPSALIDLRLIQMCFMRGIHRSVAVQTHIQSELFCQLFETNRGYVSKWGRIHRFSIIRIQKMMVHILHLAKIQKVNF